MKNFNAKNKIAVLAILWLVLSVACFVYFFPIMDSANQEVLDSMASKKNDLGLLRSQAEVQRRAEADLKELAKKPLQPEFFFSRDVTLVKEIKTLEAMSQRFDVETDISGVSGTVTTATAAKTITPLVVIPYSIGIRGKLSNVIDFIETLENLRFITNISTVSLDTSGEGRVVAGVTANFYLLK